MNCLDWLVGINLICVAIIIRNLLVAARYHRQIALNDKACWRLVNEHRKGDV